MRVLLEGLVLMTLSGAVLAGANPLMGQTPPATSSSLSAEKAARKEREIAECQRSGGLMGADGVCRQPEPVFLPRDGVTDELLEKYRLKK